MAKFFYKMQNILDIKLKLETQARNEFAIANAQLAEEEEKLDALERRRQQYENRLAELYTDKLDIQYILHFIEKLSHDRSPVRISAAAVPILHQTNISYQHPGTGIH